MFQLGMFQILRNDGNVAASTNTEFGTQPPSDIQSPTSFHIPSASGRGVSPTDLSHWKASRSENLHTAATVTAARGFSATTRSCPLPVVGEKSAARIPYADTWPKTWSKEKRIEAEARYAKLPEDFHTTERVAVRPPPSLTP